MFIYVDRSLYILGFVLATVYVMLGLIGLIMFAYFGDCDPFTAGRITNKDQVCFYKLSYLYILSYSFTIMYASCLDNLQHSHVISA